jgi:hypothetical protein
VPLIVGRGVVRFGSFECRAPALSTPMTILHNFCTITVILEQKVRVPFDFNSLMKS